MKCYPNKLDWILLFGIFQADEMIREGDKNGDGKIQYEGKANSCKFMLISLVQ